MRIYNKTEFLLEKERLKKEIEKGAVFIYPTDTIYGIGCNALNDKSVAKIRELKLRNTQPFSVISPGKEWIINNCEFHEDNWNWLKKLPGQYTFILNLKNTNAVSRHVNSGANTLGVRIPSHWFSDIVFEMGIPIVTTSVNKTGEPYMTSLEDLDDDIKNKVDFIIYENEKKGAPSTLVIFDKDKVEVKERKL
jgi:tRNA threonylcarbamoyl adenosine modification protein (Sua5/YciO/YrdC/YwlC family)